MKRSLKNRLDTMQTLIQPKEQIGILCVCYDPERREETNRMIEEWKQNNPNKLVSITVCLPCPEHINENDEIWIEEPHVIGFSV
jgi:hypothetical protein